MKRTRFFIPIRYREVVGMKSRAWRCYLSFTRLKGAGTRAFQPGRRSLISLTQFEAGNFCPLAHPLILLCNNPAEIALRIGEISDCSRLSITVDEPFRLRHTILTKL